MSELTFESGNSRYVLSLESGCNVFSWQCEGDELLYCPEGFPEVAKGFFDGGNPLLFPSVGRTWDRSGAEPVADRFRLFGHEEPFSMPCHGYIGPGSWNVLDRSVAGEDIEARFEFEIAESERLRFSPFDVGLRMTYRFGPRRLAMCAELTNCGNVTAPVAFGLHPYFCISSKPEITIELPCTHRMDLDEELLIPTGISPLESNVLTFAAGEGCDCGFVGAGGGEAVLRDSGAGRTVRIAGDANIDSFVVYSDTVDDFVCVEPWTRGCGQYEDLANDGWAGRGKLIVLAPGETRPVNISFAID
jgi:galactose mutarotase-like enzyme